MRLLHAADLHLDSPLRGLDRYEGSPPVDAIRGATRRALENLVALAVAEEVALLLLAGDLYDGDWKDWSTGLFFSAQMARLREAGVRVALVHGNHDAASVITRRLRLPENVRVLAAGAPETWALEELGVAVHGQSFATRAVTEDLASRYPAPVRGLLNVGLLHTCATGRPGHESYAPCHLETLAGKGYDYWALGHVHAREVLLREPWAVFPGNLQGRHARETGAKGATLVEVAEGRVARVEHRPLDVVRFEVATVDAAEAASAEDAVDLARAALGRALEAAAGRTLAARVVLEGATRADARLRADLDRWTQEVRAAATDLAGEAIWVERLVVRTTPAGAPRRGKGAAAGDDPVSGLVRSIRALASDDAALCALLEEFAELRRKLPAELQREEGLRLDDPETLRRLLPDVEPMLVERLLGAEGPAEPTPPGGGRG